MAARGAARAPAGRARRFGISGGGRMRWFSTHPTLEERIDALRRMG
jgi:Zn-dependent protease with chaperone function